MTTTNYLVRRCFEAGTIIHIRGYPFRLAYDTILEGHEDNFPLALMSQAEPPTPDYSRVLENALRPRWKRWLGIR